MGVVNEKVAGIFLEAAVDALNEEFILSESQQLDKAIKKVNSALKNAHTGLLARAKTKQLHDVLDNYNREIAISTIHKYAKDYEVFINATSSITGRKVVYFKDYYIDKSDSYITNDIKFTIFIVYFAAITEKGTGVALNKVFKEIFKATKKAIN